MAEKTPGEAPQGLLFLQPGVHEQLPDTFCRPEAQQPPVDSILPAVIGNRREPLPAGSSAEVDEMHALFSRPFQCPQRMPPPQMHEAPHRADARDGDQRRKSCLEKPGNTGHENERHRHRQPDHPSGASATRGNEFNSIQ